MHDTESETFVIKSIPEQYSDKLEKIGISSAPIEIATDEMENDDYYSRVFSQTTRMVTNNQYFHSFEIRFNLLISRVADCSTSMH